MKVFISYKWEDQDHNAWVERLASDLFNNGIDPLLDKWEIRFGESLSDYMTRGINTADAMLFIMTPKSIEAAEKAASKGGAVQFEVRSGLSRLLDGKGDFRLIGLLRRGDDPVVHLRDSLYVDFRDDDSYETSLRQLVADLKGFTKKHPTVTELSQKPRPDQ